MVAIAMYTARGEQHGLIGQLPNSVPFNDFKNLDPSHAEQKRKEKKDDERLVPVRYINHQDPINGILEKPYCRYAGDPIQLWKLFANHEYKLPMGFIKEVNESRMPIRAGLQSVDGKDITKDGSPLEKDSFERIHELVSTKF